MATREHWDRAWESLGTQAPPEGVFEELLAHYAEPHRAYHTLNHIRECFAHLESAPGVQHTAEFELALWFHDVIYDTHAADNEEQSAAWGRAIMEPLSVAPAAINRVVALVLVTKHNVEPANQDEGLFLDIDLAILGAPESRFDEYEAQVRREYAWVPEEIFRTTRAQILRQFQQRPRLYHSDYFHNRLEAQAKDNLARSLANLDRP